MLTLFNLYDQAYADGGILVISVWKDEKGVPSKSYALPGGQGYRPKEGYETDVAYKFNNFRNRPLSELWEQALPMMEPITDAFESSDSTRH